jgi:hypothetical protein
VRVEVKRGAARTAGELLVYGNTLPTVTGFQRTLVRAKEYLAELGRPEGLSFAESEALEVLAQVQVETARSLTESVGSEERYLAAGPEGPFDLRARLADQRRTDVLAIEDPAVIRAAGDDLSKRAAVEASAGLLAAFAFLLASLANALRRGRLVTWWAGAGVLGLAVGAAVVLELVPVA